jgi:putative DNA primase/helicase
MAINLEILPWAPGEAFAAATACFKAWLDARGGKDAAEERDGITAVRAYLSQHGPSRFPAAWETSVDLKIIINLAGFRKGVCRDEHFVGEDDDWDFYITTDALNEVTAGINKRALAETLVKRAFLIPENDRHRSKQIRVPGIGLRRLYHISHKIFEADDA